MTDKDFLQWIHDRLVSQHKENEYTDFMYKLRPIIKRIPKDQITPVFTIDDKE